MNFLVVVEKLISLMEHCNAKIENTITARRTELD